MLEQLQAWQQWQMASLADTAVSMLAAFLLGGLIGLERQYRQREAGYPLGSLEVRPFAAGQVELTATLLSMSVDAEVLDRAAVALERMDGVSQAFWHPSSAE
jgi:uncharacterized membrane protein